MQQPGSYEQRIERAKELLHIVRHAALATVNEDGSPHNSPVFATWDDQLNSYWSSHPDSQHSQNIARDGQVFVVIFDSLNQGGGLYVAGKARMLEGEELAAGLKVLNQNRARLDKPPITQENFEAPHAQRLYRADYVTAWVNVTERSADGNVLKEYRREVAPELITGGKYTLD